MEVPPPEATATYPQGPPPAITPPNQCYAPQIDPNGNVITDKIGNMSPDFSKPMPCPPQQ
jgi:ubiquitin-protein ligase